MPTALGRISSLPNCPIAGAITTGRRTGWRGCYKAGINLGQVTVVEVGVLKRAIVYHSDVLNTAARVQALCNEHGKTLLVTQAVKEKLAGTPFAFEFVGDILLRGKAQTVGVYSVGRDGASIQRAPMNQRDRAN